MIRPAPDRFERGRFNKAFLELRTSRFSIARSDGPGRSTSRQVPERANAGLTEEPEVIRLQVPVFSGAGATIAFEALPLREYVLQASDGLKASWRNMSTNHTDSAGKGAFTDSSASEAESWVRFYRVMRLPME